VVFVPALTGLGAPYWDPHARGLFSGLTRGTTRAHLARAALEGIALQNCDLLTAMQKDLGRALPALNVDGGASANNLLMQIQSDLLGRKLRRPVLRETTSLGAVFVAGLGASLWSGLQDLKETWKLDREFQPKAPIPYRKETLRLWDKAIERTLL
jgi:glycerol kinase